MSDPRWEEDAALEALGLLDEAERAELRRRAAGDPEVARAIREFSSAAAMLAHDAPQVAPPSALRRQIMAAIEAAPPAARATAGAMIIPFASWVLPYAVAACLMGLILLQYLLIDRLDHRLHEEHVALVQLRTDDSMLQLRLAEMKALNNDFANARIMVAWDPVRHRGLVTLQNLPAPPPGHDYQLWVLDPAAKAPVSAGLIPRNVQAQDFAAHPVRSMDPGFAISLEPAGGRAQPTPGQILFAVAAAQ